MFVGRIIIVALLLLSSYPARPAFAANTTVEKIFCQSAIGFKSEDELRSDLLLEVKRSAVNELFGELISVSSEAENFVVTSDQIRASSVGFIRIDGNPSYYNGVGFAQVCIKIKAYSTEQDKAKFAPVEIINRHCVTDSTKTMRQLADFAKEEVIIDALTKRDRRLSAVSRDELLRLVQQVEFIESGLVPDTETYCVKMRGLVTPIEIITLVESTTATSKTQIDDSAKKTGVPKAEPPNISDFVWVDKTHDVVGMWNEFSANGVLDGHFRVSLRSGQEAEIDAINISSIDENGNPQHEQWDTNETALFPVGVVSGTAQINSRYKSPLMKIPAGITELDLYANEAKFFPLNRKFRLTVTWASGEASKKIITI